VAAVPLALHYASDALLEVRPLLRFLLIDVSLAGSMLWKDARQKKNHQPPNLRGEATPPRLYILSRPWRIVSCMDKCGKIDNRGYPKYPKRKEKSILSAEGVSSKCSKHKLKKRLISTNFTLVPRTRRQLRCGSGLYPAHQQLLLERVRKVPFRRLC
jgi:hypothetical protein